MKTIKLHHPLINTVQEGLENIFQEGSYADKEVQKIIRSKKQFGSKDRAFIAETIYDIVRWKNNYQQIISSLNLLTTSWKPFIFISLLKRGYSILNPEVLDINIHSLTPGNPPINTISDARISFPEWLDKHCLQELGEAWNEIAGALHEPAKVYIRTNTLKTNTKQLLEALHAEEIEAIAVSTKIGSVYIKDCIEIRSKNNLRNSTLYANGWFEFQDIGSQAIGLFCGVRSDYTVLDLCAGAGGKTIQLSALMQNKGMIYATDFNENRLVNLEKRMIQAGCKNIKIISYAEAKKIKELDVLLIDAPCSGLGTIKRHPDLKWKLKEEHINNYISIQQELLEEHKDQIKKSGQIIYATCSILPSESEDQIKKFLRNNTGFSLQEEIRIQPNEYSCDGFYLSSLIKNKS